MLRPDGAPACGQGPPAPEIQRFLQGPQPRGFELARAIRIFVEVLRGFRALHFVGPCVTVFGSARFAADHHDYGMAREVGAGLARADVGPGQGRLVEPSGSTWVR